MDSLKEKTLDDLFSDIGIFFLKHEKFERAANIYGMSEWNGRDCVNCYGNRYFEDLKTSLKKMFFNQHSTKIPCNVFDEVSKNYNVVTIADTKLLKISNHYLYCGNLFLGEY